MIKIFDQRSGKMLPRLFNNELHGSFLPTGSKKMSWLDLGVVVGPCCQLLTRACIKIWIHINRTHEPYLKKIRESLHVDI